MTVFKRLGEWMRGLGPAIDADVAEFEREVLKDLPADAESTTTVTTERHDGVLVTVTKTTVRRVTRTEVVKR